MAVLFCAAYAFAPFVARADENTCGDPPSLPTVLENSESVKGELQGQANILSKLVGKAELGGQIETAKKTINQNSSEYFAAQKTAYLAYMFCKIVMTDATLSAAQKLEAIGKFATTEPPRDTAGKQAKLRLLIGWINAGVVIQDTFIQNDNADAIKRDYEAWAQSVYSGLTNNIDESYAVEFRSTHGGIERPTGHSYEGGAYYAELSAKIQILNRIMGDVRR
jgi:hypothetical protein